MKAFFPNIFLVLITLLQLECFAQEPEIVEDKVEKGNVLFGLQLGIPLREMQAATKNNMGNLGFGLALSGMTNPFSWGKNKKNSPLRIGGEIGYTYYGRFLSDVYVNGVHGFYKTSYGILHANALIRLLPSAPSHIRPFFEILMGGNFYLSSTKEDLSAIESAFGIKGFDMGSYASAGFNKGIAVGCSFGKKKRKVQDALFTLRLSYNRGSDIKYVIRNSLTYNPSNGGLEYYVGQARVKYLAVQIGVGL
jgi:hypothetical protein